jgi:hypothetical protein
VFSDNDGNQFHQYQENKQLPLNLTHWTEKRKLKQWGSSIPPISAKQTINSIGGIDDPHCLNFLFCVQWVKMRGDCFPDIDGINIRKTNTHTHTHTHTHTICGGHQYTQTNANNVKRH